MLDPVRAELVVSQRIRGHFFWFLRDGLLASYEPDADGTPLVRIWRVRVSKSL